jgi:hypothetical protein
MPIIPATVEAETRRLWFKASLGKNKKTLSQKTGLSTCGSRL